MQQEKQINVNEQLNLIKQIIIDADKDIERLPSDCDKIRIEAYEAIRRVLGYTDYIPPLDC